MFGPRCVLISSLAQRPRRITRRQLPIRPSAIRVSLAAEPPWWRLSSAVVHRSQPCGIDIACLIVDFIPTETFFPFPRDLVLETARRAHHRRERQTKNMAQEARPSGTMSLQEKLDKIRSPKLQNQHQVDKFSPPSQQCAAELETLTDTLDGHCALCGGRYPERSED